MSWPSSTQGATGNSGVAKLVKATDGAIGYVDFSDANASDLTYASIKNSAGKFIKPTLASAAAAARRARRSTPTSPTTRSTRRARRRTRSRRRRGSSCTQNQTDAAKGNALKGFLNYIYGDGQKLAPVGRLRAAAQGAAQAGQGAGQEDHRPGVVTSGGSCTGRVPPARPVPPLDDLQYRVDSGSPHGSHGPAPTDRPPAPARGSRDGPPAARASSPTSVFRWIALAAGLLVLAILGADRVHDHEERVAVVPARRASGSSPTTGIRRRASSAPGR